MRTTLAALALSAAAALDCDGSAGVEECGANRLGNAPMPLFLVDKADAERSGGVCLDGSPPGFYFSAATAEADSTSWVLYFKGGGWCYEESSCAARATGALGSSKHFAPTFSFSGLMDSDPSVSDFAGFNRAILWYSLGRGGGQRADGLRLVLA